MFKRHVHGDDIVYYNGNKIAAAVVKGDLCRQLYPDNNNLQDNLRYLVMSCVGCGNLKPKHLEKLANLAKSRDGVATSLLDESIRFVLDGRTITATYDDE